MNTKLTLVELIDMLAESTSTSKRVCELFLRELFSTVSQELINGETVKIKNIGTFKVTEVKSRKSVNVVDGEDIEISGHKKISFTPDKSLAEAVNQPFAQFETVVLDDALTDDKLAAIDEKYPSVALDSSVEETPIPAPQEKAPAPEETPVVPEPPVAPEPPVVPEPQVTPEPPVAPVDTPPIERKPMLVGIPIDGPSHPVPEAAPVEEPVVNDRFYRPELRDAYSPTEEQLSAAKPKRNLMWLWALLGVALLAGILWLVLGHQGSSSAPDQAVPLDTAELYVEENDVVTDTVTAQIVLTVLAEKHYGSPWFWVYIYEENKDKISNPNNIRPGTEVVIPPADKYGIDPKDPASLKKAQRRSWEILTLGKR
ncbi:MAG: HU family DNA-binding protein [Muribaculaceae bacterium]|nr:HU family DNA-binding protein [Muribaculaceae bacterium]